MAIRTGMSTLVSKLRDLTGVSTSEYSDNDLQDVLDENKYLYSDVRLTVTPFYTAGNVLIYRYIYLPKTLGDWFEVPLTNTINEYFSLYDYQHGTVLFGTGDDKVVYESNFKRIVLNTVPDHKLFYLTIYSYDLYGAAAYIWNNKLTDRVSYIDIRTDNHTLSFDQEYQHCKERYVYFYNKSIKARSHRLIRRDQGAGIEQVTGYTSAYQPVDHNGY